MSAAGMEDTEVMSLLESVFRYSEALAEDNRGARVNICFAAHVMAALGKSFISQWASFCATRRGVIILVLSTPASASACEAIFHPIPDVEDAIHLLIVTSHERTYPSNLPVVFTLLKSSNAIEPATGVGVGIIAWMVLSRLESPSGRKAREIQFTGSEE